MASAGSGLPRGVGAPDRRSRPRRSRRAHTADGKLDGIAGIQRNRMIAATAVAARERGAAAVSVTDIVTKAGVSRRTFYELFQDRDECLAATLDEAIARAAALVLPAWEGEPEWRVAVREALRAFLAFLDDDPTLGVFLLIDSLGAGDAALERRGEVLETLIDAIDLGRARARAPAGISRLTAEGVVGAVLAIMHARLLELGPCATGASASGCRSMTEMHGQLAAILFLPYLGPAAADREGRRLPAQHTNAGRQRRGSELMELEIRLTYRTVRVLRALAELRSEGLDPSNRQIGERAGVVDQGQISKLLHRLARAGLIENRGGSRERGEANAWRLTAKGARVERAIRGGA